MESGCINSGSSIYFQCRKTAARYNEKMESREGAAEYLGISVSSLANYELGITKVVPVDVVMRMADLYNAPQIKNLYCKNECPLGKEQPLAIEVKTLEEVTIGILSKLDGEEIGSMKKLLLEIAEDGKISPDEEDDFNKIVSKMDKLSLTISELKLLAKKYLAKGQAL